MKHSRASRNRRRARFPGESRPPAVVAVTADCLGLAAGARLPSSAAPPHRHQPRRREPTDGADPMKPSRTPETRAARPFPAEGARLPKWRWVVAIAATCVGLAAAALSPAVDRRTAEPAAGHARAVALDGLLATTADVPAGVRRCCP